MSERRVLAPFTIESPRLLLRPFGDADLPAFAALNADPVVMAHFPAVLSRAESDAAVGRIRAHFAAHGFGFWALERKDNGVFIGFTGLLHTPFQTPFTPCVEVGWRLAHAHWGAGFALEAARAAIRFGFERLGLQEIVSFTVPANWRSRRVMERLGMQHDPSGDFHHPRVPMDHPLQRHVLYRLRR